MGLKEGSLESLIKGGSYPDYVAEHVFNHMVQALDFLATEGIIHRDLKPANVLYVTGPSNRYKY
jgi:serine/threonine protein kinase